MKLVQQGAEIPVAAAAAAARWRIRKRLWVVATHAGLLAACFVVGLPLLFALLKSTQSPSQVFSYPPRILPGTALVANYRAVWEQFQLGIFMRNSFIVAVAVTVGKTVLSLLSGLALVFFRFPLQGAVFWFILATLMMPTDILILALFELVSDIGWTNSHLALVVPFLGSATGTFLFRQHFSNIPISLAEAAKIDGAGPLRFLWSILIPMSWNTIGALAVIQFVYVWNQYLWPLVIIRENSRQVVQVGLKLIGGGVGLDATNWGITLAGAVIALIPPLVVFMLLQEQFMRGFALREEK